MTEGLRLQVRRRSGPTDEGESVSSWNYFARLHPSVAQELYRQALQRNPTTSGRLSSGLRAVESHLSSSSTCDSGVEFLPLAIVLETGETIYASYNGGDVNNEISDKERVIDLPCCMINDESISEVEVSALSTIDDAEQILVEPVTDDDWRLIESSAAWLEEGGLLRQLSVVYPGQIVTTRLERNVTASFRVLPDSFRGPLCVWSDSEPLCPCLRLAADTRVVVKPRATKSTQRSANLALRVLPSLEDYSVAARELAQRLEVNVVSVAQFSAAVHPTVALNLHDSDDSNEFLASITCSSSIQQRLSTSEAIIWVSSSEFVPVDRIVLHPLTRIDIGAEPFMDEVYLSSLSTDECDRFNLMSGRAAKRLLRIDIERVAVVPRASGSPWRIAECSWQETKKHSALRDTNGRIFLDELAQSELLSSEYPIQCGCLFRLGDQCHYRLVAPADSPNRPVFVFPKDLIALLSHSASSRDIPVHTVELPQPMTVVGGRLIHVPFPASLSNKILESAALKREIFGCLSLICGSVGSGKTFVANAMALSVQLTDRCPIVYLDCRRLKGDVGVKLQDMLQEIQKVFEDATRSRSSVLILDDLDELVPNCDVDAGAEGSSHIQRLNPVLTDQCRVIEGLLCWLVQDLNRRSHDCMFVATARNPHAISPAVRSVMSPSSPEVVFLPLLSPSDRAHLYMQFIGTTFTSKGDLSDASVLNDFIRKATHGYRPRDLQQLATLAIRFQDTLNSTMSNRLMEASRIAVKEYVPWSEIAAPTDKTKRTYGLSAVGGLFHVKRELMSTIIRPSLYRRVYGSAKIKLPRGVLLFGPTGCGKSFLVSALARECNYSLVSCRGPEILDRYIGASELKVRELFSRAASVSPCILWIDELDALAPRRGTDSTGVTDRIVNQLLTLLDGVEDISRTQPIYVVATSSRPDKVDRALLRPGRIEKHLYVGFAETEDEWTDIAVRISGDYSVDEDLRVFIQSGDLFRHACASVDDALDLSPADVKALFGGAQLHLAHEMLRSGGQLGTATLSRRHILAAMSETRPSLAKSGRETLQQIYSTFEGRERKPAASVGTLKVALK